MERKAALAGRQGTGRAKVPRDRLTLTPAPARRRAAVGAGDSSPSPTRARAAPAAQVAAAATAVPEVAAAGGPARGKVTKVGKRTGIAIKAQPKDAGGLERVDGFFSSPAAATPVLRRSSRGARQPQDDDSVSERDSIASADDRPVGPVSAQVESRVAAASRAAAPSSPTSPAAVAGAPVVVRATKFAPRLVPGLDDLEIDRVIKPDASASLPTQRRDSTASSGSEGASPSRGAASPSRSAASPSKSAAAVASRATAAAAVTTASAAARKEEQEDVYDLGAADDYIEDTAERGGLDVADSSSSSSSSRSRSPSPSPSSRRDSPASPATIQSGPGAAARDDGEEDENEQQQQQQSPRRQKGKAEAEEELLAVGEDEDEEEYDEDEDEDGMELPPRLKGIMRGAAPDAQDAIRELDLMEAESSSESDSEDSWSGQDSGSEEEDEDPEQGEEDGNLGAARAAKRNRYRIKVLSARSSPPRANPRPARRRFPRLNAWEGERLLYARQREGDIVFDEVVAAGKPALFQTPPVSSRAPRAPGQSRSGGARRRKRARTGAGADGEGDEEQGLPPVILPSGVKWDNPAEPLTYVDRNTGAAREVAVVSVSNALDLADLPVDRTERFQDADGRRHKASTSKAGALLNDDKFLSGLVVLPPFCAKPMENVDNFLQVFSVVDAQPKSLAVMVGGKNFLLSKDDQFWVPPFADYSLRNYSSVKEGRLTFVLIKPPQEEQQQADA
jgi:hypothetical protein